MIGAGQLNQLNEDIIGAVLKCINLSGLGVLRG
jgi:hypothetical protein